MEKQRVIEIKCVNASGVLNRITAIFFARGISIDSMISTETKDDNKYIIFIELTYDSKTTTYIVKLLSKLVDVIRAREITDEIHVETQITLAKVTCKDNDQCLRQFKEFNIEVLGHKDDSFYVEFANNKEKTDKFIKTLKEMAIVEYVKSGRLFLK